jgi:hypothetical protein
MSRGCFPLRFKLTLRTREAHMPLVFIAHADEDYPFIKPLVYDLESAGYRCWFYEQDTKAAASYLVQVYEAIQQADAFLLIASNDSLKSTNVTREVEQAHQRGDLRPIMVLKNIDAKQLERCQPLWHMVVGTTVHLTANDGYESRLKDEIVGGLKALGLEADKQVARTPSLRLRPNVVRSAALRKITPWASDGSQIKPQFIRDVLFLNDKIREFIEADQQFLFIAGEKGLGKTLLLKYKRYLLTEAYETKNDSDNRDSGVVFIPESRPYLDLMANLPYLDQKHEDFLADARNCKRLWSFAIRMAVISHFPERLRELREYALSHRLHRLEDFCSQANLAPTQIFGESLSLGLKELNNTLDGSEFRLERIFRSVQSGALVFIDKVDQGIGNLAKEAWINVQGGLLEAAWDCTNTNAHVRIFGTIRDEAFANYASQIKANLQNAVLSLRYSEDDLRQIIDRLANVYEGVQEFSEFIQMTTVRNNRTFIVEDCFKYMARHTVGRPRDLVVLCAMLHKGPNQISEDVFRKTVNNTAANEVVRNLFEEMNMFLGSLGTKEDRQQFFRLIPYNILTRDELGAIADQFDASCPPANGRRFTHNGKQHPFCDLWTCGLLGVVNDDHLQNAVVMQRFKQPHEPGSGFPGCIPTADYYLLHPSLHASIRTERGADYEMFSCIEIGHHSSWHEYYTVLINLQRELFKLPAEQRAQREAIVSVLPYLQAHLAAEGDFLQCMPRTTRDRFDQALEQFEKLECPELCKQLNLIHMKIKPEKSLPKTREKSPKRAQGETLSELL